MDYGHKRKLANLKIIKKTLTVTIISFVLALAAYLLTFAARSDSAAVTRIYTTSVFRWISLPVKFLSNLCPFSLFEIGLFLLVLYVPVSLIIAIVKMVRNRSGWHGLKQLLKYFTLFFFFVFFFEIFGGYNYYGQTFAETSGYVLEDASAYELRDLCLYLGRKASENYALLEKDENGVTVTGKNLFDLLSEAELGYENISERFPELKGYYTRPKPAIMSKAMCYLQISGIYPYIVPEAVVNHMTPDAQFPHTICHEMAHQRGFAREDEANYISYLACINNPEPIFRYSGYLEAFSYSMNALYGTSPLLWEEVAGKVNSGLFRDLSAASSFWSSFETPRDIVARVSESVNDTYLQIQSVPDGIRSYGRMVDLLLAEYRLNGGED